MQSPPASRQRASLRLLTSTVAVVLLAAGAGALAVAQPAAASAPLRVHASAIGMHIGASVESHRLISDNDYRLILATEFNSITPMDAMTWEQLQPSQGNYAFANADTAVSFAYQNAQSVRGHSLVWHEQIPAWLPSLSGSALHQAMASHIHTVINRYGNHVDHWNVVNEPLAEDGSLRDSFWLQGLGPQYIGEALYQARMAAPAGTKLYLNDYGIAGINAKSNGLYSLVQQLLAGGVPLDGIGIQGQLVTGQVPGSLQQNLQRFANLGLEVSITQLKIPANAPVSHPGLIQQASDYQTVVQACIAVAGCDGVTVWSLNSQSWIPDPGPAPGTSISEWLPKPVYQAVHDTLAAAAPPPSPPPPPPASRG